MALPFIELLSYELGEFIFMILFYNTGALLIRIFTLGKITLPIGDTGKEKPKLKYILICSLSGFAFYILIISIFIIALKNITS